MDAQPDPEKPVYVPRRVHVVRRGQEVAHVRSPLKPGEEQQGYEALRPGERLVTGGAVELKALLEDLETRRKR